MGQATIDLPDTTDIAAPGGADDLLSQMAGDEIDRLLAEAEIERPEPVEGERRGAPTPAPRGAADAFAGAAAGGHDRKTIEPPLPPPAPPAPGDVESQLDDLHRALIADEPTVDPSRAPIDASPVARAPMPVHAVAPPPPIDDSAKVQAELDSLFDQLNGGTGAAAASTEAVANVDVPIPSEIPPSPPSESHDAATDAQTHDEGAEVDEAHLESLRAAIDFAHADPAPDDAIDEAQPVTRCWIEWACKPLVWVNAPLDGRPEAVRGAIGKIALVTLFNALAVLGYVLFFRHS